MRTASKNAMLGILVAASAIAAASSPSRAQSYPWCLILIDKAGAWTCYFATRQQCVASSGGNLGNCIQNPAYPGPQPAPRRRANG